MYGSEAYNRISILAHHSSHPWNVVCHLCLVLHNICFSSWAVGGSFPNYMLNKDKFAPGQNFEASGATSTAENTKGKKQNFACFDLIRCVLSLSYKREIPVRSEVWLSFFTFFSIYSFWCSFGLYLNKKIPPQHPPPFLQFNPKVLFVSRVSARPLRLSEKFFEKGTNNCQ